MTRRTLPALLLAALLSLSLLTPAAAAARFSDVPASAWYASDVQDVQQYGILQGVGSNRFLPQGTLTYAQAITMAARADAYLHHKTLPSGSASPWYQPYVDYALDEGLIEEHDLPWSLDAACTRESMAQLFYAIVDGDQLSIRNSVDNIPDVPYEPRTASIYQLYRFGILTGSDAYGTFHPDQSITRAEAAAILNRLLNPAKRKTFTLQQPSPMQSLDLTKAWSCSEWINREQYVTSLAFFADGSLYGLYYIPNSSFSMSMRGTYTAEGNTLRLNVYWAGRFSPGHVYHGENGLRLPPDRHQRTSALSIPPAGRHLPLHPRPGHDRPAVQSGLPPALGLGEYVKPPQTIVSQATNAKSRGPTHTAVLCLKGIRPVCPKPGLAFLLLRRHLASRFWADKKIPKPYGFRILVETTELESVTSRV